MKKGQILTGQVTETYFPAKGIVVTQEGEICTVKNVIPGQQISFRVKKTKSKKGEGIVQEIIEKSPDEISPLCPYFGNCGGCTYLNLPYEKQAELKEKQVKQLLDGVLIKQESTYSFEPVRFSKRQYGYRNKMEFTFGDEYKDGPLALGLHKRNSFYDLVSVYDCQICDEDYRMILKETLDYFEKQKLPYYHRLRHTGFLRHLLVRKAAGTGEILIALVTTTQQEFDLKEYTERMKNLSLKGTIRGILHTKNDSVADTVQSDETDILFGQDYITEILMGQRFKISEFSFFQTNSFGAEVLYQTAREFIGEFGTEKPVIFDLYSGTGTIAQMMAPVAKKVIGVEIVEEAVAAAKENALTNKLTNCEFICGNVLNVLDEIDELPDFIILDPPRDGVHQKALQKILNYGVNRLLYISCKPTSLVRDLEAFLSAGYEVRRAVPVDQFPWTANVETVCLLSKLHEAKHHVDVRLDMDELDLTSVESKAAYEEIKAYVAEHNDGMKVSNLYIAQIKKKCGIEVGENFNLPKSKDTRQPQCPKEKEDAIVEALEFFKMI